MGQIEAKDRVGSTVGECEEISSADEEVPVKVGDFHSLRATNTHDGFEACWLRQSLVQFALEARSIPLWVEANI